MKNTNNVVDSILEAQKNAAKKVTENTKKIYGDNPLTEAVSKGTDMYAEWLNKQKAAYDSFQQKATNASEINKERMHTATDYFQSWMDTQMEQARIAWEAGQNMMKQFTPGNMSNPLEGFQKMTDSFNNVFSEGYKNYNNFINQANNAQQWFEMMNKYNPFNQANQFNDWSKQMPNLFNSYFEVLNNSVSEFQKNFNNNSAQDIYSSMASNALSYGKFMEMWAPFWKSIQEKTFDVETFKKTFNVASLKDLTDSWFNLAPESVTVPYQQAISQMKQQFKSFADFAKSSYGQANNMFQNNNPFAGFNPFAQILDSYQTSNQWFQNAVSPIAKLVTPNDYTKKAQAWSNIMDKFAVYSVKNAELQYLMYQQSNKSIEQLANLVSKKIEQDEPIESLTSLYQEWLNTCDKVFVELFESETYSKLMAEVSALQLRLKKDIDAQYEEVLGKLPIATKSELDELYKIIYDLKKEVRQLEKMIELDEKLETTTSANSTASTTSATKSSTSNTSKAATVKSAINRKTKK